MRSKLFLLALRASNVAAGYCRPLNCCLCALCLLIQVCKERVEIEGGPACPHRLVAAVEAESVGQALPASYGSSESRAHSVSKDGVLRLRLQSEDQSSACFATASKLAWLPAVGAPRLVPNKPRQTMRPVGIAHARVWCSLSPTRPKRSSVAQGMIMNFRPK